MNKFLILFFGLTILQHSCSLLDRSNEELYEDFFGKPVNNCIKVLASRDARAMDDQMLYIHFKTCPKEIKRIFSLSSYFFHAMNKLQIETAYQHPETIDESFIPSLPNWWNIRELGDSYIRFEYRHENEDHAQIGYMSLDSSEVFYKEVFW